MTPRALRFERGPTIWRPLKNASKDKAVTVMVDLSRGAAGCKRARLLDAVPGRSGRVFADWFGQQGVEVTVTVEHAALDPPSQAGVPPQGATERAEAGHERQA